MIINDLITGNFMERPNRFTVLVNMEDKIEKAHLRDPGRLIE
jgi:sugar fermentation stimulation protein A